MIKDRRDDGGKGMETSNDREIKRAKGKKPYTYIQIYISK